MRMDHDRWAQTGIAGLDDVLDKLRAPGEEPRPNSASRAAGPNPSARTILPNFFARNTLVGNVCWPTCSKTTSTSLPPVSSRTRLPNFLQASIRALLLSGVSGGLYIRSG